MTLKLLSIFVLLLCSFVLSAAEVALYSMTSSKENLKGKIGGRLTESPQLLLTTILVGNAVAVFLLTLLGASLAMDVSARVGISRTLSMIVEIIVVSGLLIIVADAVPKIIASRNPKLVMNFSLPLLVLLVIVESPLVIPLSKFLSWLTARRKKLPITIDNSSLKTLSEIAGSAGVIDEQEADLLRKISYLGDKNVKVAMTPRTQIVGVSSGSKFDEVVDAFNASGHSRLPVFSGSPDNVAGMLYARDVLPLLHGRKSVKSFDALSVARKPVFVPESQSIENLLETFRTNRVHVAMAVDEFGGLAGLVTLSDIVREIFGAGGELPREGTPIVRQRDGSYLIKGGVRLEEIAAEIGHLAMEFNPEDTISSLLIERRGTVPRVGAKFEFGNCIFEVDQATAKSILQVRLRRLTDETPGGNN